MPSQQGTSHCQRFTVPDLLRSLTTRAGLPACPPLPSFQATQSTLFLDGLAAVVVLRGWHVEVRRLLRGEVSVDERQWRRWQRRGGSSVETVAGLGAVGVVIGVFLILAGWKVGQTGKAVLFVFAALLAASVR